MELYYKGNDPAVGVLWEEVRKIKSLPDNLMLVAGGDGTMLQAVNTLGTDNIYLGINFGHLGFLMNSIKGGNYQAFLRSLRDGQFTSYEFPMLRMSTLSGTKTDIALNDIYVERSTGQSCRIRVMVDDVMVVWEMACDGIIVSTALGSTAYNHSAGGPASHPLIPAMFMTPICPHRPRLGTYVVPITSTIKLEVLEKEKRPARVSVDGRDLNDVKEVVVQTALEKAHIAFTHDHDFTQSIVDKVLLT